MGEIKIFGYILIVGLLVASIIMPLTEVVFIYRERLMIGDALYNSCRVAAEYSYNYNEMRTTDAVSYKNVFLDAFEQAFASSFDLEIRPRYGNTLHFEPSAVKRDMYNNFSVEVTFDDDPFGDKTISIVTVEAESYYVFKIRYMRYLNEVGRIEYELRANREYVMEVTN